MFIDNGLEELVGDRPVGTPIEVLHGDFHVAPLNGRHNSKIPSMVGKPPSDPTPASPVATPASFPLSGIDVANSVVWTL
jgi:hypothetical protein